MFRYVDVAKRPYSQTKRAEQSAATRLRIVAALVALHEEVGPARTTVDAVAKRAGVQRLTVYRHFDDELSMIQACSAHYASFVPLPDSGLWSDERDPATRLGLALSAFYDYYARAERMLDQVLRDEELVSALKQVLAGWHGVIDQARDELAAAWPATPSVHTRIAATIGHALRYETWRSLVRREGMPQAQAVELLCGMAASASRD